MPVYEYACTDCGQRTERLLPYARAAEAGPCPACEGTLERRFSRVAVRLNAWGFSKTDGFVPDRPGRGSFRDVQQRAERIAEPD